MRLHEVLKNENGKLDVVIARLLEAGEQPLDDASVFAIDAAMVLSVYHHYAKQSRIKKIKNTKVDTEKKKTLAREMLKRGETVKTTAEATGMGVATIYRIRQRMYYESPPRRTGPRKRNPTPDDA